MKIFKWTFQELEILDKKINEIKAIKRILPLLPIDKGNLESLEHFGSSERWKYLLDQWLIGCFLFSLIVACMFRKKENLFNRKEFVNVIQTFLSWEEETNSKLLDKIISNQKKMDENERYDSKEKQMLFHMFNLNFDEIKKFSDLLYFEPWEFGKQTDYIIDLFTQYFDVASEKLNVKEHFPAILIKIALIYSIEHIQNITKWFYDTIDDPNNISDNEIMRYWNWLVIIDRKDNHQAIQNYQQSSDTKSIVDSTKINIQSISNLDIDEIINITKGFILWPNNKKNLFLKHFNPNKFLLQLKDNEEKFVKILHNISDSSFEDKNDANTKQLIVSEWKIDYVKEVLHKINWENVSPYLITILWKNWSQHIRNIIFWYCKLFKITLPSLKSQYLFDHKDMRLLEFVVRKIKELDMIKTKKTWNELINYHSSELPKSQYILKKYFAKNK